ncbi:MAG: hypothetical protein ACOYJD_02730 [Christensenellales bacterium]
MLKTFAALLLSCVMLLSACTQNGGVVTPKSSEEGFFNAGQKVEGGSDEQSENVNIKNVQIDEREGDIVITLSFMLGTATSDVDTASMSNVPKYSAFCLGAPHRFVLRFDSITYWDYDESLEMPEDLSVITGMFRPLINVTTDTTQLSQPVYLYFQTNGETAYKIEENKDRLIVTLRSVEPESREKTWHAVSNALFDIDKIPEDLGMTPTLCADYMRKVLISPPFMSEAEANEYMGRAKSVFSDAGVDDAMKVIALEYGQLPEFDDELADRILTQKSLIKANGRELTLDMVMPYSSYFCSTPDGQKMVFSRTLRESENSGIGEDIDLGIEELWIMEVHGRASKLISTEFRPIRQAEFSPDGSKLAFVEMAAQNTVMYVYDMESKGIPRNISEEGIGGITGAFVWDGSGDALYLMSGDDGILQLKKYDFTQPEGSRVSVISEEEIYTSDFAYWNGALYYYVQYGEDISPYGTIYKLDPATGEKAEFADGSEFTISPDGRYMAIREGSYSEAFFSGDDDFDYKPTTSLKMKDMTSGDETYIVKDMDVGKFVWSPDGKTLYYTKNIADTIDEDDEFIYSLLANQAGTSNSVELCRMITSDFYSTKLDGRLLLSIVFTGADGAGNNSLYATYMLDLSKL